MTAQDTGSRTESDAGAYERHYAPDAYDARPSASELARDAYEDDRPARDEDNACPECDDGIVVSSDRMEHDTGHYPYPTAATVAVVSVAEATCCGERARTVAAALLLAATFAALVWAASEGEHLRCHRLIAAHNPAASTYCEGQR